MSVRIRLRRMGRKKQPHYRVVVADGAAPRDGRIVENLGYYKPKSSPARLVLDLERFDYWVKAGAEPSDTVASLAGKARRGGDGTIAVGEPDVEAQKRQHTESLAARRSAERAERKDAAGAPRVEPQDVPGGDPAASSSTDASAAETMAAAAEPPATPQNRKAGKAKGAETEGVPDAE